MIVCRSWKAPTAPSGPRTCSARARHDDTPGRPHDLGHRPLSQRSFLWPERLTAGGAAAKEASSGAVGPGEALGTLVTISGYVKRPRYARLNTPMGADGAISCMSCASYQRRQLCMPRTSSLRGRAYRARRSRREPIATSRVQSYEYLKVLAGT